MRHSESIKELATALGKFQGAMKPLDLDATVNVRSKSGAEYSFKYATIGNIVKSCRDQLSKNGLAISQLIGEGGAVTTMLMHTSGEFLCDTLTITPGEKNPQAIGSAISYAKRYAYSAILGLVADDDDDANIAEGNRFETTKKTEKSTENSALPWLNKGTRAYSSILSRVQTGNYNLDGTEVHDFDTLIAHVKTKYRINKEIMDELNAENESMFNKAMNSDNPPHHT